MHRFSLFALAALTLSACQDAVAPTPQTAVPTPQSNVATGRDDASEPIAGKYIVVFKDGVRDVPGLARALAQANGGTVRFTYQRALRGFAADLPDRAAAALARNPNVAYVEQDQVMHAFTTEAGATWGIDRIDQRARPLSGTYTYTNTGAGVTAYIIDTGIRFDHQ